MTTIPQDAPYIVAALYKFVTLDDVAALRAPLQAFCESHQITGTLLLANEGINGTVAGSRVAITALKEHLSSDARFAGWEYKESWAEKRPFHRMKVRIKREIVTLGVPGVDPNKVVGTYLDPKAWNDVIQDPEVLLIDTRNDYEVALGTFKGAVDPKTRTFREFPAFVRENFDPARHKKVAMCCTGGIRCEKASSLMKTMGFEEVYHLKGGILRYLEDVPAEQSLWEGSCFVFDQRVSVVHGLAQGENNLCYGCRMPITPEDLQSPHYEAGVSCPGCYQTQSEVTRARARERQKQILLAKQRGAPDPRFG